jgi:energy-coupling factor transporter ATP-binding protein EcfA2
MTVLVLLAIALFTLWPFMGVLNRAIWASGTFWDLSESVRLWAVIGVSGALGASFREVFRSVQRLGSAEGASEALLRDALLALMLVVVGGLIPITLGVVFQGLLVTSQSSGGLGDLNPYGLLIVSMGAGFYGVEWILSMGGNLSIPKVAEVEKPIVPVFPRPERPRPLADEVKRGDDAVVLPIRQRSETSTVTSALRVQWEQHPDDPDIVRQFVNALRDAGQIDEAAHALDALIDARPDDAQLVREKAALYRSVGDERRYVETVKAAEEISDRNTFKDNVGKTITLSQVELHDLPFFANFTWDLQPNVNVLLGRNGYGKSHLLRVIVGMLQNHRAVTGQFFSQKPPRGAKPSLRIDVVKEGGTESCVRTRLLFEQQFGVVPLLAIPDMRYIEKSGDAFAPTSGPLDLSRQGASHFLEERSYQGLILTFLYELSREFNPQERFNRPIFRLIEEVVQVLTDRSFEFADVEPLDSAGYRILVKTDGNESNPLPLQKASQGTLSVLSMVGLVYRFLKSVHPHVPEHALLQQQAIVVIDEIDAHLHPLWQQQILQLFRDKFPNVQFIITAHSPLVIAGCKKREVAVLMKGTAGGFTVDVKQEHFIGASPETLYRDVFRVEDPDLAYMRLGTLQPRAPKFRKRVEELQDLDTRTEAESAELEDLLEKLFYLDEADHIDAERKQAAAFARDRQRMELELKNTEGKVNELESQVSALKQELDTKTSSTETPSS